MAGRRSGAAAAAAAPAAPAGAGGVMHDDPMDWERTVEYVNAPEVSLPTPMDYVMTGPANAGPEHTVTTTIYPDNAMFGSMGGLVEAVHVAYYEFNTSSGPKRILMLGELHETKSLEHQTVDVRMKNPAMNSQVVDYLDRLSEALAIDGRCLDVYVEYRFNSPKDRPEVGLVDMRARLNQRGGAHGRSMLRAYLSSGKVRPGIDAAAAAREKRNRRNHRYDMRNLGGAYGKNYCIPNYGCSGSHSDDVMTVDDYIAMYLGIGPQSQGGKPLPAVVAKWNQLRAREATRTRGKPPADEGYMNMLRRRYRKAFSDFQRATTQGQNMAHMLFAIRLAVLQGSRGLLSTYLVPANKIGEIFVNGWVTEVFADIAGFFRMFRAFDASKHPADGTCAGKSEQNNLVWLSHFGHAMTVMTLIATIFEAAPIYVDGQHKNVVGACLKFMYEKYVEVSKGGNPMIPSSRVFVPDATGAPVMQRIHDFTVDPQNFRPATPLVMEVRAGGAARPFFKAV